METVMLRVLAPSLLILALFLTNCSGVSQEGPPAVRPNIVIILADDLGWSDISPYGAEIETPNLQRLADGGVRFTNFHNTAKCFPSRATLLTGLYAQQVGMDKKFGAIRNGVTFGEVLRAAGYRTYWSGKHHGTENPYNRGFDRYFGLRDGACNFFNPGEQRPGEGKPAQKRPDRTWCIDAECFQPYNPPAGFYTTDAFTDYALGYLEEDKDDERPFLLYLAYNAPHDPLQAWPEDIAKYRDAYKAGYEEIRNRRYARQGELGVIDERFPLSNKTHRRWNTLSEEERETEALTMAVYAAMIDRLDQNIGRVLNKLDELGVAENTIVMFASDNGASAENVTRGHHIPGDGEIGGMERWTSLKRDWANVGNTPYRLFKNHSHEGGICTPFILYWPGKVRAGRIIHDYPAHFIDVMPTLIEVAGAEYPAEHNGEMVHPIAGESLLPALDGSKEARDRPLFFQWSRGRAIIDGQWKLVSWAKEKGAEAEWELYNLAADKTETKNLATSDPETVARLAGAYSAWFHSVRRE
jgi:arylsulfatase